MDKILFYFLPFTFMAIASIPCILADRMKRRTSHVQVKQYKQSHNAVKHALHATQAAGSVCTWKSESKKTYHYRLT